VRQGECCKTLCWTKAIQKRIKTELFVSRMAALYTKRVIRETLAIIMLTIEMGLDLTQPELTFDPQ